MTHEQEDAHATCILALEVVKERGGGEAMSASLRRLYRRATTLVLLLQQLQRLFFFAPFLALFSDLLCDFVVVLLLFVV